MYDAGRIGERIDGGGYKDDGVGRLPTVCGGEDCGSGKSGHPGLTDRNDGRSWFQARHHLQHVFDVGVEPEEALLDPHMTHIDPVGHVDAKPGYQTDDEVAQHDGELPRQRGYNQDFARHISVCARKLDHHAERHRQNISRGNGHLFAVDGHVKNVEAPARWLIGSRKDWIAGHRCHLLSKNYYVVNTRSERWLTTLTAFDVTPVTLHS